MADRCDVDEAQVAFGGFVISGGNAAGILELVEAPLDEIAQAVEGPIYDDAQPAGLAHWDHRDDVARVSFCEPCRSHSLNLHQQSRRGQIIVHQSPDNPLFDPV